MANEKKKPRFIRTDWMRHSKLGKNRKNKQVWRRAKGKQSKMRRQRKGYPRTPKIGFGTDKNNAGKINGLVPLLVNNMNELNKADGKNIIIIASRIGARKRIEMIKMAQEKKLKILNLNMEDKK
jgi:large subunit ribosomal protein L32e